MNYWQPELFQKYEMSNYKFDVIPALNQRMMRSSNFNMISEKQVAKITREIEQSC